MPHTRWKGIKRIPNAHLNGIQLAYVRGYILALEDVLQDLDKLPVSSDTFSLIYADITRTLENAQRTITALDPEGSQKYEHSE